MYNQSQFAKKKQLNLHVYYLLSSNTGDLHCVISIQETTDFSLLFGAIIAGDILRFARADRFRRGNVRPNFELCTRQLYSLK
jgi:hypothetical protein